MPRITLIVSTRKGLWLYRSADRARWEADGPHHFGCLVHHAVLDTRDGRTLLAGVRTGHLGPTVMRTDDGGRSWREARQPPAFRTGEPRGRAVDHVFWLTPGHPSEPGVWYAGTSPQGLFRSEDGGETWQSVDGFNDHPMQQAWVGGDQDATPDGPQLHSILVDPRDRRHLYLGMSGGGVFESLDGGEGWRPLNRGVAADFLPDPNVEFGHDPHCMHLHPRRPDRLWQQNHCGIYRLDRPGDTWVRVGDAMPRDVGDIGFPIALHPRDAGTVWVCPMDGTEVWPRTSPGGRPALYVTRDAGASWQRQDRGFPAEQAWWTVKRQAMCTDDLDPVGLYLGTTNGEIWASRDEGASFACLVRHLPHVYATVAAREA